MQGDGCFSGTMGKGILNRDNLKKTVRYLKKNGICHAYYAARERIEEERKDHYHYTEPSGTVLEMQRAQTADFPYLFSIVVPAYETKERFLREMIDSVRRQSYERWELVIVDASGSGLVERTVEAIREETEEERIRYRHLRENKGIAGNTNAGIEMAAGDYIALLDHDDFLAPDALYHMASAIHKAAEEGELPVLLYSDEDKYEEGDGTTASCICGTDRIQDVENRHDNNGSYRQQHRKLGFNLDLILSNNYISHFMAVQAELLKRLKLREEYDGAQDYDLVLRVVDEVYQTTPVQDFMHRLIHIPHVLYHWRCHEESTAQNTASKSYAYEAGRRALQDFCSRRGWQAEVEHGLHLGFYEITYLPDLLSVRSEVGITGGRILDGRGRICNGAYREDAGCMYEGLPKEYSGGSTHRAVLKQDVCAVDIRCMQVTPALWEVYEQITGLPYRERMIRCGRGRKKAGKYIADITGIHCDEAGYRKLSMELGKAAAMQGYLVVWDPAVFCKKQ